MKEEWGSGKNMSYSSDSPQQSGPQQQDREKCKAGAGSVASPVAAAVLKFSDSPHRWIRAGEPSTT